MSDDEDFESFAADIASQIQTYIGDLDMDYIPCSELSTVTNRTFPDNNSCYKIVDDNYYTEGDELDLFSIFFVSLSYLNKMVIYNFSTEGEEIISVLSIYYTLDETEYHFEATKTLEGNLHFSISLILGVGRRSEIYEAGKFKRVRASLINTVKEILETDELNKNNEEEIFLNFISKSPIVLPWHIPYFESKIEEAFTDVDTFLTLPQGISGIQFIDTEVETV